jgi:hypothetical protein
LKANEIPLDLSKTNVIPLNNQYKKSENQNKNLCLGVSSTLQKKFLLLSINFGGVVLYHEGGKINREAVQVACFMERQEPEKTGAVF